MTNETKQTAIEWYAEKVFNLKPAGVQVNRLQKNDNKNKKQLFIKHKNFANKLRDKRKKQQELLNNRSRCHQQGTKQNIY